MIEGHLSTKGDPHQEPRGNTGPRDPVFRNTLKEITDPTRGDDRPGYAPVACDRAG
jgi:hypothetical protein